MATPAEVAASVLTAVPNLTTLQRLRIRNNWATAWDAHLVATGYQSYYQAGWHAHHEVLRALREVDWTTLAEQARARWEGDAERDPRAEIWRSSNRFVVRDTIRAVLARDTDIDPAVYALLTAAWRAVVPGFDA